MRPALKRTLDLLASLLLLPVLLPVAALCAIAVRVDSRGPIFFRSRRVGRHGRPFHMLKFRTMRHDVPVTGEHAAFGYKLPRHDPRITRVGRLLRATSLDELPQVWHVLTGEMSLVGPRPMLGPELAHYGHRARAVLSVRPGMTGLWQVSGRSQTSLARRIALDVAYTRRQSVRRDVAILALTLPAVLTRRGAH
jgi:exopolysaccharide production protein ExoY